MGSQWSNEDQGSRSVMDRARARWDSRRVALQVKLAGRSEQQLCEMQHGVCTMQCRAWLKMEVASALCWVGATGACQSCAMYNVQSGPAGRRAINAQ